MSKFINTTNLIMNDIKTLQKPPLMFLQLTAFGFCEYDNPESTLRCIRTLNDLQILDKKLLVYLIF